MAKKTTKAEEKEIQPLQRERGLSSYEDMEHWFDDFLSRRWMHPFRQGWLDWPEMEAPFKMRAPKIDMIDRNNEIVIRAELPGVNKDDLEVSMSENGVTIRAVTKHEEKEEKGQYYRREMSRGEFQRTLSLPGNIDTDKAKATFKDGIMELTLPKIETAKRKTIKVE